MRRSGFTLIELVATIAVIAILVALLLPAVQAVRESARRSTCHANLKQIALAVTSYESSHHQYPAVVTRNGSWHVALLPNLDQSALYRKIDFSLVSTGGPEPWEQVKDVSLPIFICPSDPAPPVSTAGAATNYLGCSGTCGTVNGCDGVFCPVNQYFVNGQNGPVNAASLRDGLSNTALLSEVLHGTGSRENRLRVVWQTPLAYSASQMPAFLAVCESIPEDPTAFGWLGGVGMLGRVWSNGSIGLSSYNHASPPFRASCNNATWVPGGIFSASSGHSGNVSVALADGHVRAFSQSVDRQIWYDLGSRQNATGVSP